MDQHDQENDEVHDDEIHVDNEEPELLNLDGVESDDGNYADENNDEDDLQAVDELEEVPLNMLETNLEPPDRNPAGYRWQGEILEFLQGRHRIMGRQINLLRNWVMRRRGRLRPDDGSESDDESDEENKKELNEILQNITFDKNLPTAHSYLGEMEECSGVAYQDLDTYQTISVLYIHDFVLIPGQTLPLLFGRPNEVAMIRQIMTQADKTFGILTKSYRPWENFDSVPVDELYDYGCTAEIRSFQDQTQHEVASVRVVVVGRQKFKVMEKRRQLDGNILAKVKILEDVQLPDLRRSVGLRWSDGKLGSFSEVHKKKFASITRAASATAWPSWLYRMYDVDYLRMQIFNEMREWNQQLEERHCPLGSSDFSFWVITNLPVSDHMKLQLLRMNSAVERLRAELHLFRKCTMLACSDCGQKIAHRKEVFSMSVSGPMAAYVNPGGFVHETLTLHKTTGIVHRGRKSTEHSWFPGYAWTICECRSCGRHIGWKFTATKSSLTPQKFWGLTRSALKHMVSGETEQDSEEEISEPVS